MPPGESAWSFGVRRTCPSYTRLLHTRPCSYVGHCRCVSSVMTDVSTLVPPTSKESGRCLSDDGERSSSKTRRLTVGRWPSPVDSSSPDKGQNYLRIYQIRYTMFARTRTVWKELLNRGTSRQSSLKPYYRINVPRRSRELKSGQAEQARTHILGEGVPWDAALGPRGIAFTRIPRDISGPRLPSKPF